MTAGELLSGGAPLSHSCLPVYVVPVIALGRIAASQKLLCMLLITVMTT